MEPGARNRNRQVADLLRAIGDVLEVKGEEQYKILAYSRAAQAIEALPETIEKLHAEKRLRTVSGIGQALEQKVAEFLDTGRLVYFDDLTAEFPPGLVQLLQVPGFGPRKARLVFDMLGVADFEALEHAAREGRLRGLRGIGEKTETHILRELERIKQRTHRHLLGRALVTAETLLRDLEKTSPSDTRLACAGSLRRMVDTIGDLDLLAASTKADAVVKAFCELPLVLEVLAAGPVKASVLVQGELQVDLRIVEPQSWGAALIYFTGSKAHNIQLRELAIRRGWKLNEYGLFDERTGRRLAGDEEDEVYRALDLAYIPPELREADGEIDAAAAGRLPRLIELSDLKGDLHVHSDWSDGAASLEDMANAARALGHDYMAITDHSPSLGFGVGLDEARVRQQRAVVQRLNKQLAPFRILHGTEMDILRDGRLDYRNEVLTEYDYVSASIHSGMKQSESEITARIQGALRNPYVHALNHPHGRRLPRRQPYAVDMQAVVETAAQEGVALEINSQPPRMDLEGSWARKAKQAGAKLVINTDSHAANQLELLRLGTASARRGWLEASDVLNTLPLNELLQALSERKAASSEARSEPRS
jgi:DNA polymerase (family 10)